MKALSDAAVERLRAAIDVPDAGERYEIRELAGRGGMGSVYRATDRTLRRDVALKVLSIGIDGIDAELAARLSREARVLARLEHPGIVTVHDAGLLTDGRPFYVMRFVRGRRLDEYARDVSSGELLRVFLRVCDAVAYAHARGVIHRDLTPANVMVGDYGDVLVLDWGVARLADGADVGPRQPRPIGSPGTKDGVVIGTPGFMAPEQGAGGARSADERADVYGLGAILRHALGLSGDATPRPLAAIIARATAKDPAQRYTSVGALAADVRRWLDGEPVLAYRERTLERLARLYRRDRTLILLLLAYAVVRVTILLWRGV